MTARWPADVEPLDLGDMPALTARFNPFPVRRDRALELRDAEIIGRLQFLIGEIAHQASQAEVPADLAHLIGQAQQVINGDLRKAA